MRKSRRESSRTLHRRAGHESCVLLRKRIGKNPAERMLAQMGKYSPRRRKNSPYVCRIVLRIMQNHGFRIRVLLQRESRSDAKSPFDSRLCDPPQRQIRNLMIVRIYPADVAVASGKHHFLRIAALHRLIRKETSAFVPCDGMARLRHTPGDTAVFLSVYAHGRIHRVPDPEIFHTSGMQTLFLPEGGNCFWVSII